MRLLNRSKGTKKKYGLQQYVIAGSITVVLGVGIVLGGIRLQKANTGVKAVELMYDFKTAYDLNDQMTELKKITTTDIYRELTIDNADRTLNTYLKFKNKPVEVEIIKSTDNYVLYRLNTEVITTNRKFMFVFDTDWLGRINYVREMEVIDFYPNLD